MNADAAREPPKADVASSALPDFGDCLYESYDGKLHIALIEGDLYIYGSKEWRLSLAKALKESTQVGYALLDTEPTGSGHEPPRFSKAIVMLGIEAKGHESPKRTLPKGVV